MIFNSLSFLIFIFPVFLTYWFFSKSLKIQNIVLLVSSYFFYAWWDWRFLSLIIISSLTDYFAALIIEVSSDPKKRKITLLLSLALNLVLLGFFKYYNFFVDSLNLALLQLGINCLNAHLEIVLPIGISFYTFQSMSYSIDVYNKKTQATRDIISFFAFISFFPQLVAGPIERAKSFLPQFQKHRSLKLSGCNEAIYRIIWGLFKKMVIADNLAPVVSDVFLNYASLNSFLLLLAACFFSIQVYCDFSGYSDIAIGLARMFGFKLRENFKYPFFATNYSELWRRWHISLISWFRDYIYFPVLNGSKETGKRLWALFVVFFLSGLWHGANWTFVIWGLINAVFTIPSFLKKKEDLAVSSSIKAFFDGVCVFLFFSMAAIFFRAENLFHAMNYFKKLLVNFHIEFDLLYLNFSPVLLLFIVFEWFSRKELYPFCDSQRGNLRNLFYFVIILFLFAYGTQSKEFVYFAF